MSSKTTTSDHQNDNQAGSNDFVLKHRVVGAAFLLFFGALILPWLLGASNNKNNQAETVPDEDNLAQQIDAELIKAVEKEKLANQEQVYISRITPVDKNSDDKTETPKSEPELKKVEKQVVQKKPKAEKPKEKVQAAPKVVKKEAAKPVVVAPSQKKAIIEPAKVDVGWIVSVGVFSDSKNVAAVMKDLKSKGFKASTSNMQTSKGPATRVWLGPFAQRIEAANAKSLLKQKTGEPGLIKAYP